MRKYDWNDLYGTVLECISDRSVGLTLHLECIKGNRYRVIVLRPYSIECYHQEQVCDPQRLMQESHLLTASESPTSLLLGFSKGYSVTVDFFYSYKVVFESNLYNSTLKPFIMFPERYISDDRQ